MFYVYFIAAIYILYSIYEFLNRDAIEWKQWLTQDKRARNISKCIKSGKPYEESEYEKKMHKRFGYKYDKWYKEYLDTGEFS